MNQDEKVVFAYLRKQYGENVVYEPVPNSTPDFAVNSDLAIEVRRLNQSVFLQGKPEGLENLSIPLFKAFTEVLRSFDSTPISKSFWVFLDFKRPLQENILHSKKQMKLALDQFLSLKEPSLPYEQVVNEQICFTLYESPLVDSRLFRPGGSTDSDAGGWLIPVYAENIRLCISQKTSKISEARSPYREWWLILVDHIGWGLDTDETEEMISIVGDLGHFTHALIIDRSGKTVLAFL